MAIGTMPSNGLVLKAFRPLKMGFCASQKETYIFFQACRVFYWKHKGTPLKLHILAVMFVFAWSQLAFALLGDPGQNQDYPVNGARVKIETNSTGKVCRITSYGPHAAAYIKDLLNENHHREFLLHASNSGVKVATSHSRNHFHQSRTTQNLKIEVNLLSTIHRISIQLRDADCALAGGTR